MKQVYDFIIDMFPDVKYANDTLAVVECKKIAIAFAEHIRQEAFEAGVKYQKFNDEPDSYKRDCIMDDDFKIPPDFEQYSKLNPLI